MDDQEQEEYIASLQDQFDKQMSSQKRLIGGLGLIIAALYMFSATYQTIKPWSLLINAPFQGVIEPASIVVGELGAAVTVGSAIFAVWSFGSQSEASWRKILTYSITLALFMFGFWSTAIFKLVAQPGGPPVAIWRLIWRPITPGLCVAAAVATIDGLDKVRPELAKIKQSRYGLKKA